MLRLGGGAFGCTLAAALLVSVFVIRGCGEGSKASHAPAFARKVLLSITSEHRHKELDLTPHPSKLHAPSIISILLYLGLATAPPASSPTHLNKQQDYYAHGPTSHHEDDAVSPSRQAELPTMQPSAPPDHFDQAPNGETSPSTHSPGPITGQVVAPPSHMIAPSVHSGNEPPNPHFENQVPAASPSPPVLPHMGQPTIAASTPASTPFLPGTPWSSSPQPPPSLPSIGSQSTPPVPSHPIAAPTFLTPPTGQDMSRTPIASPPDELSSRRKPAPKVVPPISVTPPSKLSGHNSPPPKAILPPSDRKRYNIPAAPPTMQHAFQRPPQQGQSSHSNASAVSPSSITSPAVRGPRYHVPVATPPEQPSTPSSPAHDSHVGDSSASPQSNASPTNQGKMYDTPVAVPSKHLPPLNYPQKKRPAVPPISAISPPPVPTISPIRTNHPSLPINNSTVQRPSASPATTISPVSHRRAHGVPVAAPSKRRHHHSLPVNNTNVKGHAVSPSNARSIHRSRRRHELPVAAPPKEQPSRLPPANHTHHNGSFPVISPAPHKADNASATTNSPSSTHHSPAPTPVYAPNHPYHSPSYSQEPGLPPVHAPDSSAFMKPKASAAAPIHLLPPPPPNSYCTPLSCEDPRTNSPPGTICRCVLPIKVELRLGIALYTFFTLVSELAQEIASGVLMKQSQVRVMGANAATEDPEKTVVLIDLVPLGEKFDNTTAFLVYDRFWHKQVFINPAYFGNYDVLYVLYQGLPPSPPTAPSNLDNGLSNVNDPRLRPLAVDVRNHKEKKRGGIITIIVLSSVFAFVLCTGAALVIYFKLRNRNYLTEASPTPAKAAGTGAMAVGSRLGSRPISATPSFSSSIVTYKGSAKTFSLVEMERATHRFDESRIIGEGGFGRVYEGILEDGQRVAVKILKRDDHQGSREFLAEVEMLSRLHHRNLVKLIGICTEEHIRCLVYELVPNGSVESHLHGSDKETAPLDWDARLKIALGAARALAYLHEDSSPRVIHRDFKSSNILLEHDFTPKVSDLGLARTALGEGNEHISTRVMGTFGYVAPEYAMTGHLLVKSDVYSYGVVLLELLTGRKPVDMSRPPGQENLVAWACPLLTNRDGLEAIIDPSLGSNIPFDSIAKVAAIASMCVQPEVDQRPFMGEVVQALKLVCNEGSEFNESSSFSQEDLHIQDAEIRSRASLDMEVDPGMSADLFTASAHYAMDASASFRRYSSSGPLRIGRTGQERERGLSTGSSSEHGGLPRFRIRSE